MRLEGKVIALTGGGSGIGRQLALELLRRGARVAMADIRQEGIDETVGLAGRRADDLATSVVDVTDREAVAAFADDTIAVHGVVDGYVSNAGIIQPFVKLNDLDYDVIDRVIRVSLYGAIHMAKSFLPHLLERPEAHLANVASMGAFFPFPGQTVYGAAKAGVKLLTEGLYAELLETGVGVSVVMPGAVATNITENSGVAIPGGEQAAREGSYRTTSAEEAAKIILDGIEKDRLHIYVGRDSRMMNLANRLAPRRSIHFIQRQMKGLLE